MHQLQRPVHYDARCCFRAGSLWRGAAEPLLATPPRTAAVPWECAGSIKHPQLVCIQTCQLTSAAEFSASSIRGYRQSGCVELQVGKRPSPFSFHPPCPVAACHNRRDGRQDTPHSAPVSQPRARQASGPSSSRPHPRPFRARAPTKISATADPTPPCKVLLRTAIEPTPRTHATTKPPYD